MTRQVMGQTRVCVVDKKKMKIRHVDDQHR